MTNDCLTKELLIDAIEALDNGIAIYGPDGGALLANAAGRVRYGTFYGLLDEGYSHRDAIAESVRRLHPEASPSAAERYADKTFARFLSGETYASVTDNGLEVLTTNLPMANGCRVAISIDITDLRERERELERARKEAEAAHARAEAASVAKSAFLANISHEIRTPLNGILGMAQVLEMGPLSADQREQLSTILESGRHLLALLNDVLDISKIEAGKFEIVQTVADLSQLLRGLHRLWRPRAEEKGLELNLVLDGDLPDLLSFDSVRVQQCVSNLVSNAIKFTETGSVQIVASVSPQENGGWLVRIDVRDTGPGLDAATLSRLFRPFAQEDETISRKHGGTGLGLSITRRLAEMMGGSATATSEPGCGSTFHLTFAAQPDKRADWPVADAEQDNAIVPAAPRVSDLRVLLVDDQPINRQVVRLFLRPFNMRIVEAANGVEALAALEREPFDVVLLDMHMPVLDGPSTIRRIRASDQTWCDALVIALTADAMSGDRERYLAMGMNGYLAKPISERDLISEIERVRRGAASPESLALAG